MTDGERDTDTDRDTDTEGYSTKGFKGGGKGKKVRG